MLRRPIFPASTWRFTGDDRAPVRLAISTHRRYDHCVVRDKYEIGHLARLIALDCRSERTMSTCCRRFRRAGRKCRAMPQPGRHGVFHYRSIAFESSSSRFAVCNNSISNDAIQISNANFRKILRVGNRGRESGRKRTACMTFLPFCMTSPSTTSTRIESRFTQCQRRINDGIRPRKIMPGQ
jgi:hypothetical protein